MYVVSDLLDSSEKLKKGNTAAPTALPVNIQRREKIPENGGNNSHKDAT